MDSSRKVKQIPMRSRQVRVISQPKPIVIDRDSDNSDLELPFHLAKLPDLPPVGPDQFYHPLDLLVNQPN